MRPRLGPIGVKAGEGLVNSRQLLLSSCSPSDTFSGTWRHLLQRSFWSLQQEFIRSENSTYLLTCTCELKTYTHLSITVGTLSLLLVRKQTVGWERKKSPLQDRLVHVCSSKHTQRQRYAWTHRSQTQKQMSADIRLHALHTYAWKHRLAYKHRCEQTNVNVCVNLEEYICIRLCKTVFNSWRRLSEIERLTVLSYCAWTNRLVH